MIDLHSHILPGIDDGAPDLATAIAMARAFVSDGVEVVACTPHILPGLYNNTGPGIRASVAHLQNELDALSIPLRLVPGADNHIDPDFVAGLRSGRLLTLADSSYVLVEPPHHVVPARLEDLFFAIQVSGYIPILTHPERLTWIGTRYDIIRKMFRAGVWMQITSGSLAGSFGREPRYFAEKMLGEGMVHILATDAHDVRRRPPDLGRGRALAAKALGQAEADNLVVHRPKAILDNRDPKFVAPPANDTFNNGENLNHEALHRSSQAHGIDRSGGGIAGRLRRLFE
jgi:protein-tyrosine phosphatase